VSLGAEKIQQRDSEKNFPPKIFISGRSTNCGDCRKGEPAVKQNVSTVQERWAPWSNYFRQKI